MKHEAKSMNESLKQSAANRAAMIKRFGFVPNSVLRLSYGALSSSMYRLQTERIARAVQNSPKSDEKLKDLKAKIESSLKIYEGSVALGTNSNIASVLIVEETPTKLYEGTFNSNFQQLT